MRNEGISSLEVGYGINYPSLKVTLNAYYTLLGQQNQQLPHRQRPGEGRVQQRAQRGCPPHGRGAERGPGNQPPAAAERGHQPGRLALGRQRPAQPDRRRQPPGAAWPTSPCTSTACTWATPPRTSFRLACATSRSRGFYIRPSFLLFTKYYAGFNPVNLTQRSQPHRLVPRAHLPQPRPAHGLRPAQAPAERQSAAGPQRLRAQRAQRVLLHRRSEPAASRATDPSLLQAFFNRGRTFTVGLSATL